VGRLSNVLLLTAVRQPAAEILPSLSLLAHDVRVASAQAAAVPGMPAADAVLVDARRELVQVRQLFRQLRDSGVKLPLLAVVTEGGWAAVSADWGADDLILNTAGPGEVEARLRLAIGRATTAAPQESDEVRSGELVINEATYSARIHGRSLDLTFKEFELLKFLAQNPGRVFTRSQLLQEVWGYDYFGGTRTVDVHVRRLRAKLGADHEALIGTVRNVGYRFVPAKPGGRAAGQAAGENSTGLPGTGAAGEPAVPQPGSAGADDSDGPGSTGQPGSAAQQPAAARPSGAAPRQPSGAAQQPEHADL
jgi:DNA-binding response OmpR family regulator